MDAMVYIIPAIVLFIFLSNMLKSEMLNTFMNTGCISANNKSEVLRLRNLLTDNFIVYKQLDEKGRKIFEKRVCRFIRMKTFVAGNNIKEITDQMRIMVAASAVQITFGYPGVYFKHFQTIILFAEEYYSVFTGQYHEGEVNAGGAIVLSWKNFIFGFSDPIDGRNLALHEMAHALRLTNIVDNEEYDFIDRKTMQNFEQQALIEMQKIENGENTFFRSYGAANLQEFFSVAIECFFELPLKFRDYNPHLYFLLTRILKLDLLNFKEN